jgi:F-type H+-transporting ATPase subunit alpha
MAILDKGAKNVEILKQGQYSPMAVEKQIAIIYAGTKGLLKDVPVNKVTEFEKELLELLEMKHKKILQTLKEGKLTEEVEKVLRETTLDLTSKYKNE